jgi:hypothetical protein
MTTAAHANPFGTTLSKKERKQLRKEMMQRKTELQAKFGRGNAAPVGRGKVSPNSRSFADVKPKLPGDPPKPAATPRAPKPSAAARPSSAPTPVTRPRWSRPANAAEDAEPKPPPAEAPATFSAESAPNAPGIQHLDAPGPGPLTRAAAACESAARRGLQLYRDRPWQRSAQPTPSPRPAAYRSLSLMIKPLRLLGLTAVGGAVVLGRESRLLGATDTGSLVVLGFGLALAVGLLALAEIAGGLRTVLRRL